MLRMSLAAEEYIMIGEDIKVVFLGGTGKHLRIMIDAPKDVSIVRSKVLEKLAQETEEADKLPKYYAQQEHPEKYVRKQKGKNIYTVDHRKEHSANAAKRKSAAQ